MAYRYFPKDYFVIWLALVGIGLFCRPLTPVDETRAVSVAWEMWQRRDLLVPYLNGEPYSHKPPLLQWCIHLGWLVFGVNEWSARMVAPLFALANLVLTEKLARRLWPADEPCAKMAPLLLLAIPVWALWSSLTLYDMLVTFFTLLGLLGILRAAQGDGWGGFALAALGIAGGLLSKGPAILIMLLPTALLAPWWNAPRPAWHGWFGWVFAALLAGTLLGLAWALPAGMAGGDDYRKAIFWGQTAGRLSNSFAHKLPFWWYCAWLPLLCLPWTVWPPLFRSLKVCRWDLGLRFCLSQAAFVLLAFSLISGKRIHYLLPMLPALALACARLLSLARPVPSRLDPLLAGLLLALPAFALLLLPRLGWLEGSEAAEIARQAPLAAMGFLLAISLAVSLWRPADCVAAVRTLAFGLLGLMLCAHWVYRQTQWQNSQMQAFADRLADVEQTGAAIAHWQEYHGDFTFLGRLEKPLTPIYLKGPLVQWMESHRDGYLVLIHRPDPAISEEGAEYVQFYRGQRRLMLWKCTTLLARPDLLERLLLG